MITASGGREDPVVYREAELLALTGAENRDGLGVLVDEETEYDTWLEFEPTGIEIRMGRVGILLEYPFPLSQLYEVIGELEEDYENGFGTPA